MESGTAQPSVWSGLIARIKSILLTPGVAWDQIDAEPASASQIYRNFVLPVAAIPAVAGFIGSQVFGTSILGVTFRPSFGSALVGALLQYVLTLAGVYVLALIIDALAPTFNGVRDRIQALKVAAYSATAAWVAGIFNLIPAIALLSILGLYSLYLLYLGLPKLMKAPEEKAMAYTVVTIIAAVVVWLVIGALVGAMTPRFGDGTVKIGSEASVDLGKLDEASRQVQAVAEALEKSQNAEPIAPSRLEALLPASFASMERVSLESASGGIGGIGGSSVTARYDRDDASVTVQITDLAAMGGFAALGSGLNIESNRTTANGYERVGKVDGRMVTETWDEPSRSGSYSVIVANRFVVQADGRGVDMDTLKKAVSRIDYKTLEKLASR